MYLYIYWLAKYLHLITLHYSHSFCELFYKRFACLYFAKSLAWLLLHLAFSCFIFPFFVRLIITILFLIFAKKGLISFNFFQFFCFFIYFSHFCAFLKKCLFITLFKLYLSVLLIHFYQRNKKSYLTGA